MGFFRKFILGLSLFAYLSLAVYLVAQPLISRPSFLDTFVSLNGVACGNIVGRSGHTYYVLTAAHAVNVNLMPNMIKPLRIYEGIFLGKLQYFNAERDFAILSFSYEGTLPIAKIGFGAKLMDDIVTVGTPHRMPYWIAKGNISFLSEERIFVTSANCHGSSGGPLYNLNREQIGVVHAIKTCNVYEVLYGMSMPLSNMVMCVPMTVIKNELDKRSLTFFGVSSEQY